ncbi:helix-turn-helix domain-containing protein [Lacrimispora sp. JR3]|uniref:helix-turn-helix domain-containing protein n=1 Tax=Lacrimispora sinapis TaxID=3111456 RepID=UPI003749F3E6
MNRFYNTFRTLKSSRFFRKVLFSFIFTFSIIFFIFFAIIIGGLNQSYKKDKIKTNDLSVSHFEQTTNNILKDIYGHTVTLFTRDHTLLNLIYGNEWDTGMQLEAINTVNAIQYSSDSIHSVNLINFRLKKVMTNYQFCSFDDFYDQELLSLLEKTAPSPSPVFFMPRKVNRYAPYATRQPDDVWSLIYHSSKSGAMVINIDSKAFSGFLNTGDSNKSRFYLLNSQNKILLSDGMDNFGLSFTGKALLDKIKALPQTNGHLTARLEGEKYTVSYAKDSSFGLVFLKLEPYTIFDAANGLLGFSLGISVFYLLLCLFLAFVMSGILYKPVDLLKSSVLSALPELPEEISDDDFTMLSGAYHTISMRNRRLEKFKDAYLSRSQEQELMKFLQGSSAAVTPASYTDISMLFDQNHFMVVLMELDTQKEDGPDSLTGRPGDVGLVMFSISNIADEVFTSLCPYKRIESNYSRLVYILNFDGELPEIPKALEQIHSLVNEYFKVSFSIGTSSTVCELDDLPAAKAEAENSLNRRFVNGYNSIHCFRHEDTPPENSQSYPFETEKELLAALKGLNHQKVMEALDCFFQKIASYPYSQIRLYLMWLNYNLQRFEYINNLETTPVDLETAHTLSEIRTMLEHRCTAAIQFLENKKVTNSDRAELITRLSSLIDENLCNPNLSVVYLADEVHLSVNYLRSIYKEQTGDSLSDFITRRKMELISDLLLHTNMTIQDISDKLGFTTKNYFFTFFKKHTGMTPGQYRSLHKNTDSPLDGADR